jgi:carotenoid cleavage dioxygenase-like enzyme
MKTVELDQPLASYDPKSLQGVINADGSAWVSFKVDPVNADAVARKKADPEYLDVFKVGADGKAVRKARVLGKGIRFRFGVIGDYFWLLERSPGSDRGGRALTLYSLAS